MTLMPQVLNLRHLPGFRERQPVIPSGAVYIGRRNGRDGLIATILVGFDRSTGRFATEVAVPLGTWSAARQIAHVPASDPDLLGCYSLTDAQVRQLAAVTQIMLDVRFDWFLEAATSKQRQMPQTR